MSQSPGNRTGPRQHARKQFFICVKSRSGVTSICGKCKQPMPYASQHSRMTGVETHIYVHKENPCKFAYSHDSSHICCSLLSPMSLSSCVVVFPLILTILCKIVRIIFCLHEPWFAHHACSFSHHACSEFWCILCL
jgi:hypothetical protein